jgi:hypothetical protein
MTASTKTIAAVWASIVAFIVTMIINFPPSGCAPDTKIVDNPAASLESIETTTKTVAQDLPVRADKIDNSTNNITKMVAKSAPKIANKVNESTTIIKVETEGVRNDAAKLNAALPVIDKVQTDSDAIIKSNADLKKENDKLIADKNSSLRKLVGFVIIGSIVTIAVAAACFASRSKMGMAWGITLGVGGVAALVTSIVVGYYSFWLMVGVAILAVGGVGYLVWKVHIEHKATKELVKTTEAAVHLLPKDERVGLTGDGPIPGAFDLIQSDTTKKLVKQVKDKISAGNLATRKANLT